MSILTKMVVGAVAVCAFFTFTGVTIDETGINVDNSVFVTETQKSANCIENFTSCKPQQLKDNEIVKLFSNFN